MAKIEQLSKDLLEELESFKAEGLKMLSLTENDSPKNIVSAINEFVSNAKEQSLSCVQDEILALGILLGWQYVNGLEWHWGNVIQEKDKDSAAIGVLNSDNSLFNNPMWWVNDVLNSTKVPNFLLNYNMVEAGNCPQGQPNEAKSFH